MSNEVKTIKILTGGHAKIISTLGTGGQGTVYKVEYNDKEYALKWYHKPTSPDFYNNLKNNIEKGSPAPYFIWPLFLTKKDENECYGYLMDLRNTEYKEFSDFMLAKSHFSTISAMIEAAVNICASFRILHNKGYCYQDLNDGNFFINPQTGHILICDNDNIAPVDGNIGVLGKCRYMAPEIITGKSMPDPQTDRFSLSVILFLLFFNNHPLEGEAISNCPCMTEKHEKKYYGSNPIFVYNPNDDTNRPVRGIHINVIALWNEYPKYVRDIFIQEFSKETMNNPGRRITEKEWLDRVILRLRHELVICPSCGNEVFQDIECDSFKCDDCSFEKPKRNPIIESGKYKVVINKNKCVYRYITDSSKSLMNTVSGVIVESKKNAGIYGMINKTQETWILTTKGGASRPIASGEVVPLLIGNEIAFGNGTKAKII